LTASPTFVPGQLTAAYALDSRHIVEELYQLLREIDPARWQDDLAAGARAKVEELSLRLEALSAEPVAGPALQALSARLAELDAIMLRELPSAELAPERLATAWNGFRLAVSPAYEQVARCLRPLDIHVPSLRPTNYARNLLHVCSGLLAVGLVQHLLGLRGTLLVGGGMALFAWTLESTRRLWPSWNVVLLRILGPFAHPHEAWRVNSSTWYCTALGILGLLQDIALTTVALGVLAFGDPAAAIVGRRWGRTRLVNGRSLQGSLAFVVAAGLGTAGLLSIYHPELGGAGVATSCAGAALIGAVAELYSRRVDDNLSVPLGAAAGGWLGQQALLWLS
jgi:dolichol kinase